MQLFGENGEVNRFGQEAIHAGVEAFLLRGSFLRAGGGHDRKRREQAEPLQVTKAASGVAPAEYRHVEIHQHGVGR